MTIHSKILPSAPVLLLATLLGAFMAPAPANAAPQTQHATVDGGLDKAAVRAVVAANIGEIRDCYNAELVENEAIEGNVRVSFVVQPDGSVSEAGVPESTMPARFDACVATAISSWSFPASDAPTSVLYPFAMTAG